MTGQVGRHDQVDEPVSYLWSCICGEETGGFSFSLILTDLLPHFGVTIARTASWKGGWHLPLFFAGTFVASVGDELCHSAPSPKASYACATVPLRTGDVVVASRALELCTFLLVIGGPNGQTSFSWYERSPAPSASVIGALHCIIH